MKKFLLVALSSLPAMFTSAQTTIETALDLKEGDNVYEFADVPGDGNTVYFKYTAESDVAVEVTAVSGTQSRFSASEDIGGTQTMLNYAQVMDASYNQTCIYSITKGHTVYVTASGYNKKLGVNVRFSSYPGLGKGLSADDPMPIEAGERQFAGSSYWSTSDYTPKDFYATYTASEDAQLVLTFDSYVSGATVNGASMAMESSGSSYVGKTAVEKGGKYDIVISGYRPSTFVASLAHPTAGSADMPFVIKEGENTVPASNGDYWYTFTGTQAGMASISSGSYLPAGRVKVFKNRPSSYNIDTPDFSSETGSYNVTFEYAAPGAVYYVIVSRVDDADADEAFSFSVSPYKDGDTKERPIVLDELPSTLTLPKATGEVYYAVDVPAGAKRTLSVKAVTGITQSSTTVSLLDTYGYSIIQGASSVAAIVDGGYSGSRFYVKWNSAEPSPVTFTVSLEELQPGDDINNPIEAKLGENDVKSGTTYYSYKPTKNGKLIVNVSPTMKVVFPKTASSYPEYYEYNLNGNSYTLTDVKEGTLYYIVVTNSGDDDSFELVEGDAEPGDTKDNPIKVSGDGVYRLGTDIASNRWLEYTVKNDGMLEISSNVPVMTSSGTGNNIFLVTTITSGGYTYNQEQSIASTVYDPSTETTTTSFGTTLPVKAGDNISLHLKLSEAYNDSTVVFEEREPQEGESAETAILLTPDAATQLKQSAAPTWVKFNAQKGNVRMTLSNYPNGNNVYYKSLDDVKSGTSLPLQLNTETDEDYNYTFYTVFEIEQPSTYYVRLERLSSNTDISVSGDGVTTSISGNVTVNPVVHIMDGGIRVEAGRHLAVYTLGGSKVVDRTVTGGLYVCLHKGIYIVNVDGRSHKVVIK